jgi:hypothetical protein
MLAGAREQRREVDQPGGVGAVVAVDRLVVVAHAEHGAAGCRQQPDQQQVGRREVLELVDQHDATRPLRDPSSRRVSQQDEQRPVDLVVEVDRAAPLEGRAVRGPGGGEAVDVTVVATLDLLGFDEAEADHGERLDPRSDRVAVAAAGEVDQVADDAPDVGFVDGAPRFRLRRERRRAVDDRERDRVEGSHLQTGQVAGALDHLLLGALVERHQADGGRWQVPLRVSRWRARSVSTRVLPEPAGAMIRAPPPGCVTAASWSGARSAVQMSLAEGTRNEPCSTATVWMTGMPSIGARWRTGPPSSQATVPSGSVMSPTPPGSIAVAPAPTARSSPTQTGRSGSRASTLFDHTR